MLFVATHSHTPESCFADDPTPVHQLASAEHAKECGVKVVGSYIAAPEHRFYFVLEAQEYSSVVRFFRPVMTRGIHDITPVQTLADSLGIFPVQRQRRTRRQA